MTHIVTLIGNPKSRFDSKQITNVIAEHLENYETSSLLSDGIALELKFSPSANFNQSKFTIFLKEKLGELPIDVVIQSNSDRRKKLLIADMDSTMIQQECIDELANELGIKKQVSEITARTMRGELEFESSLRERVALLKGLKISTVDKIIQTKIDITSGAITLVETMKKNGAYCSLISGGFTAFTKVISKIIGFNENIANELEVKDGLMTGHVCDPIVIKETKQARLYELLNELKIDKSESIAVGDGANDIAMIQSAGLGVAFHAKPAVAAMTNACIEYGDLTALLYLQGYHQDEFIS